MQERTTGSMARGVSALLTLLLLVPVESFAVEGGVGVYLLGQRGPLAGLIPKPGVYLSDDIWSYDAATSQPLPVSGVQANEVEADALVNIAQITWVTNAEVAGGRLAFAAVLPAGRVEVSASGTFDSGGGPLTGSTSDSTTGLGDLTVSTSLGWRDRDGESFRAWNLYAALFMPTGDYELGRLANVGKNRWALDMGAGFTLANFGGGREVSGVLGFTFNDRNDDTGYKSGIESHLELALIQHLPHNWSLGLVGYYYYQLTGDSGGAAFLGDFRGRVAAIGPEVSYQFGSRKRPLNLNLRWYIEFAARNRVEGDSVFLTLSLPLTAQD